MTGQGFGKRLRKAREKMNEWNCIFDRSIGQWLRRKSEQDKLNLNNLKLRLKSIRWLCRGRGRKHVSENIISTLRVENNRCGDNDRRWGIYIAEWNGSSQDTEFVLGWGDHDWLSWMSGKESFEESWEQEGIRRGKGRKWGRLIK